MASQGKGSKAKGSNFERTLAKQFSTWWKNGGLEGEFYKTPASGGLRWQKRDDTVGDLCTPAGFTLTIEAKNGEDWDHRHFFFGEEMDVAKSGLWAWWKQAIDEGKRAGKNPLLIIKKNHVEPLVVGLYETLVDLDSNSTTPAHYLTLIHYVDEIIIMSLKDFFRFHPKSFYSAKETNA